MAVIYEEEQTLLQCSSVPHVLDKIYYLIHPVKHVFCISLGQGLTGKPDKSETMVKPKEISIPWNKENSGGKGLCSWPSAKIKELLVSVLIPGFFISD